MLMTSLDRDFEVDEQSDNLVWQCGLIDEQNVRVRIWYSPYAFSETKVAAMTSEVVDIARWLCNVSNWKKKVQEGRRSFSFGATRETNCLISRPTIDTFELTHEVFVCS